MYNESSEKLKSSEFIDTLFISLLNEDILSFFFFFLNI